MEGLIPVPDAEQRRSCDELTRDTEPISGIDLMERASWSMVRALLAKYGNREYHFICGPGNNGGDGLAMARIMSAKGLRVQVTHFVPGEKCSRENQKNAALFRKFRPGNYRQVSTASEIHIGDYELIVDALLGSGLTGSLRPEYLSIVRALSRTGNTVVALDIPTGMLCAGVQDPAAFMRSDHVLCVQFPAISIFYPEHRIEFSICDAGILPLPCKSYFLSPQEPYREKILSALRPKSKFSHKGSNGYLLLAGGNKGMYGAIAISAAAALEMEPGNVMVMGPAEILPYLASMPRAMFRGSEIAAGAFDHHAFAKFTTLAVGPGLDTNKNAADFLQDLLKAWDKPILLDADALNLIAQDPALWDLLRPGSLITPHLKEFERLFGPTSSTEEAIQTAVRQAQKRNLYILLKGTYSVLVCPDGELYFNGSGGAHLARGGSGDQLTGRIGALWARTVDLKTAAILGMYISGSRP